MPLSSKNQVIVILIIGVTTSLAAAGAYGQNTDFQWNGTNLVRINNR